MVNFEIKSSGCDDINQKESNNSFQVLVEYNPSDDVDKDGFITVMMQIKMV